MTTSRPVRKPPSVRTSIRWRRPFSTSSACVSASPSSHGEPEARDQRRDFVPGELTTFARLRPLGHLYFELVGAQQIVRRHAEAPLGYLFDTVVGPVAILEGSVRVGIFAALARVGAGPH